MSAGVSNIWPVWVPLFVPLLKALHTLGTSEIVYLCAPKYVIKFPMYMGCSSCLARIEFTVGTVPLNMSASVIITFSSHFKGEYYVES